MTRAALSLGFIVLQAACSNPVTPGWLIDKPRVLGARVEARNDPARATLHPGESARISWLVGFPDAPLPTTWSFVACRETGTRRGTPRCGGPPFAVVSGASLASELPSFEITLPDALASTDEVLVTGQICPEAGATFDGATASGACPTADVGTTVDLRIGVGTPGTENSNPLFLESGLTFDGRPWPALDPVLDVCGAPGVVVAEPGSSHTIQVTIPAEAREPFGAGSREAIQISHFATKGTLPAQFSFVEADDPRGDAAVDVSWAMPAAGQITAGQTESRFYVVLRDGRGGASWAARAVCIR